MFPPPQRPHGGRYGSPGRPHRHLLVLHLLRLGASRVQRQRAHCRLQLLSQEDEPDNRHLFRSSAGV